MKTTSPSMNMEEQLREMNEALLVSSIRQHELTEDAQQAETAMRASEHRFREMIDALPTAIYTTDAQGRLTHFNPACVELSGRTPQVGTDHWCVTWKLFHPDGRPMPHEECPMAIALKEGRIICGAEAIAECPDGTRIWFTPYPTPLRDAAGQIVGGINMLVDITERKRAEESLRQSEERYRSLTQALTAIVWTTDAKGEFVVRQPSWSEYTGQTWEESRGFGWTNALHDDDRQRVCDLWDAARNARTLYKSDGRVWHAASNAYRHFEARAVSILDADGSVREWVGTCMDVEDREAAEAAVRVSEERFRTMADNISQLAWTCDELGNVTWYNQRWLDYTGTTFEEMKDWGWKRCHHPDHVDRVVASVTRSRDSGEPWDDTFPLRGKDGNYRWFLSRAVPIRDEQGNIVRWFGTNTDITDQRRANAEADEANRAKDMFLATLSHEMRTPLSAIVGWMQILQGGREGGCDDAELNEGLEVIERNGRAMVQLMDDVLDVSRIVSGKVRLEVCPCELSEVIRAGIDVVRSAAQAKDITISVQLDPAASRTSCDAARMQQVVWNLLSNAVKFTPKRGTVRVTLTREKTDVRIEVIDSGQGISPELLPYVFDRFRQADSSTRRKFGGLGLGLSIVKQLVELHGGTVQAHSEGEGHGATFSVVLPIRAVFIDESDDDPDEKNEFVPSSTATLPLARLDGLRVLVVDDEFDARRLLVKVLHQAGAIVTAVGSAAEAIDSLGTANPEVLVSDLGMPDQDGFDLIGEVRKRGYDAKDLPAIALTAFVRKTDRRQALLAGFQVHVAKPVDPHELTEFIASLAGRTGPTT